MDNLKTRARAALVVAIALMAVSGMFAGSAAAAVTSLTASTPVDVAGGSSDTTQEIAGTGNTLDFKSSQTGSSVAIKIDISDLVDAGVDISNAEVVDANGDPGFAVSGGGGASDAFSTVDTEAQEIHLVVSGTDDTNTVNIDELELAGLDTSNVGTAQNLEYVIRADDQNAGDFGDSGFSTDSIATTDTFNIATIEVENLDTGEQISTTTMTDAISEANDPSSNDLGGGSAGDQVEIRPEAGTYVFDGESITDDNTRIVPLNGADVTFQNDDGDDTLTVGASNVEIENITFDQDTNDADAVRINDGTDNTAITDSTFTGVPDTDGQDVVDVSDGAGAVTIDNSEFVGDGVAATAINAGPNDNGDDDLDLTVTNTNITGFDDPDGTNGEGIILANAISSATIENNNFDNNDQHVDDEAGVTTLSTVFSNNNFAEQYVTIENTNGDIQEAIYGDLDTAEATNSEIDAAANGGTVTIAGQHTVTSAIDLANNGNDGLTVTAAGSGATIVSDNDPVFALSTSDANNIKVSGLTFDLSNGAHEAIDDTGNNYAGLSVTDNTFNGANGDAVVVNLGEGTYDAGLTVNDNTFDSENDYQAISVNGGGLSGTDDFEINGNSINDADGSDAIALGVLGDGQIELSVQNNEITNQTNNNALSLDPDTVDTVTIEDNTLTGENDGAGTGLSIVDAGDNAAGSAVSVSNNDISGFDNEGGSGTAVSTEAADVSFSGNSLVDNAVQFSDVDDNYDEQSIIDNNNVSPVVLGLDQRGGDIQDNAVYGTVEGGVTGADAAGAVRFLDVGAGTYEENSITVNALGGGNSLTIDGSNGATLTTDTDNQIIDVDTPGAEVTISNLTFAPSADNANPDIDVTNADDLLTVENNVFSGPGTDSRQGVFIDDIIADTTVTISDNEFSNYAEAVQYDDGDDTDNTFTVEVIRNSITDNGVGVDLVDGDGAADNADADTFVVHFNNIVNNSEDGVNAQLTNNEIATDGISVRGNWFGDESGPSGDFSGDGDAITSSNDDDTVVAPWLADSVDTLPTDRYVVIPDPVSPIADGNKNAEVLVATLNDSLAQGEDEASTVLIADPAGPISFTENAGSVSAANPVLYTIGASETGNYTLTAANTDDNIAAGSATQTFTGQASDVIVEVDSDTLTADDETTINATATLVDDNGNAVDRGGSYGVTWLVSGSNDAGVTRVTEEDFNTVTPDSEARLEISAENASVDLTITAQADTGGFTNSTSATTVAPAAANFTLDLVEGPTTITQNESYSATVNVTNTGDAAGTQDITYDLEDSTGISQVSATEEDVQLNASASQEVTFEVAASDTESLNTGDFTHVFSSNDDELTLDVTVQAADEPVQVALENTTLDPSSVSANTTNDHDLTFDAVNVSDDGNTDSFTVTIPSAATLESANSVSVVDANGTDVSLSGGPDVSGNEITFDVAPDSSADTRTLSVTANVTVAAPDVENETTADITVDVSDSNNGQDSADVTLTVAPADADPEDPVDRFDTNGEPGIQSGEVLNAISAFNEDTRIGGEPVESGDVLDVISAFNEA